MKYLLSIIYSLLLSQSLIAQNGQLLVVIQPSDSLFKNTVYPQLQELADKQNISYQVWDIAKGLPQEITTTPAIIFQNSRGRSIYAGRYMSKGNITNFLRTARLVPQSSDLLVKSHLPVAQLGRMQLAIPIKITPLQGDKQATDFQLKAIEAITAGMKGFIWTDSLALQRSDRLFYLDIHPYTNQGKLYLSYAIFSQFSCIDPIVQVFDKPVVGNWENQEELWKEVGALAATSIQQQLKESAIGDAYSPINKQIPIIGWDTMGLQELSATNEHQAMMEGTQGKSIPQHWKYLGAVDEGLPALQFRFAEPLSRYAGEIKRLSGELIFKDQLLIEGSIEAAVSSLTMGAEDFDQKVLKSYVKAKRFPISTLEVTNIIINSPLAWGQSTNVVMEAALQLLKNNEPVQVQAKLLPFMTKDGQARLLVEAQFSSNITQGYGIQGPDGPSPARETLDFFGYFLMEAIE